MGRWRNFVYQWPTRFVRLCRHIVYPFTDKYGKNTFPATTLSEWCADLIFYIIDVVAIPEFYETIFLMVKWNSRRMNDFELATARSIFGTAIQYDLVRIDQNARFGTKKLALAYVSFNTINYRHSISTEIFIHEMVHIWQYQQFGSIYIARAIKAQKSKEGYDYGGVSNLYNVMLKGGSLLDFNFEQQADIIEDFYRIQQQKDLAISMNMQVFRYFSSEVMG